MVHIFKLDKTQTGQVHYTKYTKKYGYVDNGKRESQAQRANFGMFLMSLAASCFRSVAQGARFCSIPPPLAHTALPHLCIVGERK